MPLPQAFFDGGMDVGARFLTRDPARKQCVVARVLMPDVGAHGEFDGARLQLLGGSGTPHTT